MALMRGLARVDKDGKISIPENVRREVGFKPGTLVEVKPVARKSIMISAKETVREGGAR